MQFKSHTEYMITFGREKYRMRVKTKQKSGRRTERIGKEKKTK